MPVEPAVIATTTDIGLWWSLARHKSMGMIATTATVISQSRHRLKHLQAQTSGHNN